jgi:anti-sigma regulatory factor (Ser/Thr protein kinase)
MPESRQTIVQISYVIANRRSELQRLLCLVDDFAARHDMPSQAWYCARLALEEIITNLLKYAYPQSAEHEIMIRLALRPRELALRIEDNAPRFNPLEHIRHNSAQNRRHKAQGGHGLLLVRRLMDEFKYRRYRRKNIVTLKKKIV